MEPQGPPEMPTERREGALREPIAATPTVARTEAGAPPPPPPPPPPTGTPFGRYLLVSQLGRGGMGVVWKAWDPELKRTVALKQILSQRADDGDAERFLREARAAARLSHPGIVGVHEVGEAEGKPYFTTDYVDGTSLDNVPMPMPPRDAAALVCQVAEALAYAHGHGIVHRDVKPANVLVDAERRPYLMDFGLARDLTRELGASLTLSGEFLGTPAYMSPEQARGGAHTAGPSSDQFSLGAVLYQLLTGQRAFRGAVLPVLLEAVIHQDPLPPTRVNPRVHRDLETICLKALAKEASRRYASMTDFAADLHRFLRGEAILARPPGVGKRLARFVSSHRLIAATVATLAVSGGVALSYWATRPGWLTLDVTPPDALVRLDAAAPMSAAAVTRHALSPGKHSLQVERKGFLPAPLEITIGRAVEEKLPVNLKPVHQELSIETDPFHCYVTLTDAQGREQHRMSPFREIFDTGEYQVVAEGLRAADSVRVRAPIEVAEGRPSSLRVTLPPAALWTAKESQRCVLAAARLAGSGEPVLAAVSGDDEAEFFHGRDGRSLSKARAGRTGVMALVGGGASEDPRVLAIDGQGDTELFRFGRAEPAWKAVPARVPGRQARPLRIGASADGSSLECWVARAGGLDRVDPGTGKTSASLDIPDLGEFLPLDGIGFAVQRRDSLALYALDGEEVAHAATPAFEPYFGLMAAADLDGDGTRELLVRYGDRSIVAWRTRPLTRLWSTGPSDRTLRGDFAVGVLRSGERPSVVSTWEGNTVRVWSEDGAVRWTRDVPASMGTCPVLADMLDDGTRELIYESRDALWIYDLFAGRVLEEVPVAGPMQSYFAIADLDDDGLLDVALSLDDGTIQVVPGRRVIWSYATSAAIRRPPVMADLDGSGTPSAVFCSLDNNLYALEGRTGRRVWSVPMEGQAATTPALVGGDVVAASWGGGEGGLAVRVEGATGRVVWSYRPTAERCAVHFHASPVVGQAGGGAAVFLADIREYHQGKEGADGGVHALDARDGHVLWVKGLDGPVTAAPVVLAPTELVVGDRHGDLVCLDTKDGTVAWSERHEGEFTLDAARAPDGAWCWTLLPTGELLEVRAGQRGSKVAEGLGRGLFVAWAKGGRGTAAIVVAGDQARAVVDGGRRELWRHTFSHALSAAPLAADLDGDGQDEVVLADEKGEVTCLDAESGERRWRFEAGAGIDARPVAADVDGDGKPEVVLATMDGRLIVISGLGHRWSCEWSSPGGDRWCTNAPATVGPER